MLLLANFYVSLIKDHLSDTMGDPESLPKDYEVVDYIMESLTSLLTGKKTKMDQKEEQNATGNSTELSTSDPIGHVQILLKNIHADFAYYQDN